MNANVITAQPIKVNKQQCRFCPYWSNWHVKRHENSKHGSQLASQPSPVLKHVYQPPVNQLGDKINHYNNSQPSSVHRIHNSGMEYVASQLSINPQPQQFPPVPVIQRQPIQYDDPQLTTQPQLPGHSMHFSATQPSTQHQLPNQTVVSAGAREGDGFLKQQPTDSDDLNSISSSYDGGIKRDLLDSSYDDVNTDGSEEDYSDDDSDTGEPLEIHDEFKLISDRLMENLEMASDIRNDYALLINKLDLMKFDKGKDKKNLRKCFAMYLKYREKIDLFMKEFNFVWKLNNSNDEEDGESEDEMENDESDTEEMEGEGDCDGSVNEEQVEEMDESENSENKRKVLSDLKSYSYYDWIWAVIPKKMLNTFCQKMSEKEEPEYYKGDLED